MSPRTSQLLFACALLAGCSNEGGESNPSAHDTDAGTGTTGTDGDLPDPTGADETVTYWRDAAPLFYQHCGSCHREGGAAPFSLLTYEDARPFATASASAVSSRTMPPWLAHADGSCGEFADSQWLPDSAIATLTAWADAGAPEGEPRDDLEVPSLPSLDDAVTLTTPDFLPEIVGGDLAAFDEYRCFLVDPGFTQDGFLTAYDVVPGNEAIVHHVLAMPVEPGREVEGQTNLDVLQALDAASPDRDGWECFGAAGDGVEIDGIPVAWAPGQGVVEMPDGVGVRVRAGDLVVIQVHYNLADESLRGQRDQTEVRLRIEEAVEHEAYVALPDALLESIFGGEPHLLAPGKASEKFTWSLAASDLVGPTGSLDIYGVFPHMHEFGRKLDVQLRRADGETACVLDVPRWDFGWQRQYFYTQPLPLEPGDVLEVTCDYDTTSVDEPVAPGWGTHNEMCLVGLTFVPRAG